MAHLLADIEALKQAWLPSARHRVTSAVGHLQSHVDAQHGDLSLVRDALENARLAMVCVTFSDFAQWLLNTYLQMTFAVLSGSVSRIAADVSDMGRMLRQVPGGSSLAAVWASEWPASLAAALETSRAAEMVLLHAHRDVLEAAALVAITRGGASDAELQEIAELRERVDSSAARLPDSPSTAVLVSMADLDSTPFHRRLRRSTLFAVGEFVDSAPL